MSKTIMIIAGGTGGHVMPGLALARKLKAQGHTVYWMSNGLGLEQRLVPQAGIRLYRIPISSFRKQGLSAPFALLSNVRHAMRALRKAKPDLVIGMGSYITVPGGLAAYLLRLPFVIHEQNVVPGLANRFLSRFAKRIFTAFPDTFSSSSKTCYTGNPVREDFLDIKRNQTETEKNDSLKVLVIGGSQGAHAINTVLPLTLRRFDLRARPQVVHQTGLADVKQVTRAYNEANVSAKVVSFIDDMASAYAWADVVVARAGAMSIAEITTVGIASVLIPYPHADGHQVKNARYLSDRGAAVLIPQPKLTPAILYEALLRFHEDRNLLNEMAKQAKGLAKMDALQAVVQSCEEILSD